MGRVLEELELVVDAERVAAACEVWVVMKLHVEEEYDVTK